MKSSFFTLIVMFLLFASPAKADQNLAIVPYYPYDVENISRGHLFTTSLLTGLNLSSMLINRSQMKRNSLDLTLPIIGIGTGIGQIVTGSLYYSRYPEYTLYGYYQSNRFNNNMSMMDIGVGTLTAAFNTYALIRAIKGRKQRTDVSWNVFGYKNSATKQFSMGLTFTKQI